MGRRKKSRRASRSSGGLWDGLNRQDPRQLMGRDRVALPPPLHGGMVAMAQSPCERTDAAALANDLLVAGHVRTVRTERTDVNSVETVRGGSDNRRMARPTTGEALLALKARSGLSLDQIAAGAGYKGRSGVQAYFSPDYDIALDTRVAAKLAAALAGKGQPPIEKADVFGLTGIPEPNARVLRYEGAADVTLPRDVPIYGTALGAPQDFQGNAIEQTMLNTGDIIGYLPRPTVLNGQEGAYGLYVQGSSMSPRFEDGETIFATDQRRSRPPRIGDDVVVYLVDMDDGDGERASAVLVKRLVRRTAEYTELEQFNPAVTFRIETSRILRMDRVIPWSELLS